jgi:hypothetical protein
MTYKIMAFYKDEKYSFLVKDNVTLLKFFSWIAAIVLNKKIAYVKRPLHEALARNRYLIAHEAIHIYQARMLGWKYIPMYLWHWMRAGFKYRENIMEQEAYTNERIVYWNFQ